MSTSIEPEKLGLTADCLELLQNILDKNVDLYHWSPENRAHLQELIDELKAAAAAKQGGSA